MKSKLFYLLLLLFCLTENANAQLAGNIKSSITDNKRTALPQVNMILYKTNFHTTTNDKGEYIIDHIPSGGYRLVISHIGYQSITRDIFVKNNETVEYSCALQASTFEIPSVDVYGGSRFYTCL
jgi:hypothetical protein